MVFVLAIAARVLLTFTNAGQSGPPNYDPGVYYAAGDALTFGRLPYRDFILLHPPGLMLVLAPFALLGRLTTDHAGFITANFAFIVLAGVNSVLIVRIATRLGLGRMAALAGGLFYALWFGSAGAEYMLRLETLGNFFLLVGLLGYVVAENSPKRYPAILCGLGFGAAASVKIWWIVPLVLILAWHLVARRPLRRLGLTTAGAAASLLLINGPFFLAAPSQMWHMVVTEQLGRWRGPTTALGRLNQLSSVGLFTVHLQHSSVVAVVVLFGAVFVGAAVLAWRVRGGRLMVVLAVAQLLLLVVAPSWFAFYTDYATPALALTLAAAVGGAAVTAVRRGTAWRAGPVLCAAVPIAFFAAITIAIGVMRPAALIRPFPSRQLASAVASPSYRCVMADSPMGLIELNVLSRDFANGCRNWVDVSGRTYGVDRGRTATGKPIGRSENLIWQRDLLNYLRSGQAIVLVRISGTGISRATLAAIRAGGVLKRAGGYTVYRVPG